MDSSESRVGATFPTTHWSLVTSAGDPTDPAARAALEVLCRDYWYPLYALARRQGMDREDSGDLVQSFLSDLLERQDLASADPARGRFRNFLGGACIHFIANRREYAQAAKRGGGRRRLPIDLASAEGRYGRDLAHELTPERLFERRWALELLSHVLNRLEKETANARLFKLLRPTLEGDENADGYAAIGRAAGMSEGAVKVAAHRLRTRYRDLLREEVARTVNNPDEIDAEIAELMAALV